MKVIILFFMISSCSSMQKPQDEFHKKWIGQNKTVLDKHPQFSLLEKKQEILNKRESNLIYTTVKVTESTNKIDCLPMSESITIDGISDNSTSCIEFPEEEKCFYNFKIKNQKVTSIDITGLNCTMECSLLPNSKCD